MGAVASRVQNQFDKAAAVTLHAAGAAVTSTATDTAISLSELNKAWWSNFEIPHGKFVVVWDVIACVADDNDETYVLSLLVDDVLAMNNSPVTIDSFTLPRGTVGAFPRVIDSREIPLLDTDHDGGDKFIASKVTLGGTTPSITYMAWIAKCLGA